MTAVTSAPNDGRLDSLKSAVQEAVDFANAWPDEPDTRDLGVMLDRIQLTIPVSRAAGGSP